MRFVRVITLNGLHAFYDTARLMNFSTLQRTRAGWGRGRRGCLCPDYDKDRSGVEGGAADSILFFDAASALFFEPPGVSGDGGKYRKKVPGKVFCQQRKGKRKEFTG